MIAVVTDPATVEPRQAVPIECRADDEELLLADWLNALIYEMATRRLIFGKWQVSLRGHELEACVEGEPVDRARHHPAVEVKGTTYTALSVEQDDAGNWRGQCVVDV
jgi:tRNA nucleotidyltransferase (CCA-adding enzyme)